MESRQIRVKRRMGRLHRLLVFSFNEVKGTYLKPNFQADFCLRPGNSWINDFLAVGCHPDPVGARLDPNELSTVINRPSANAKVDEANDEGDAAEGGKIGEEEESGHVGKEKDTDKNDSGREAESEPAPPPSAPRNPLDDKVALACRLPETPRPFRYPFAETVDVDAMLHEVKAKVCLLLPTSECPFING
jgi:hypothetical protein